MEEGAALASLVLSLPAATLSEFAISSEEWDIAILQPFLCQDANLLLCLQTLLHEKVEPPKLRDIPQMGAACRLVVHCQ